MKKICEQDVLFIAALNATTLNIHSILQDGKILHVWEAVLIRLFSQFLRVPYKVLIPHDDEWGRKLPDGNWSGLMGMVSRSEADLAVGSIMLTEERFKVLNFSYPYLYSEMIFMTDKPKPISASFVLFHPFSGALWISIAVSFFTISFLLFIVANQRKTFQSVLFMIFGSLFGQPICLTEHNRNPRLLLSLWFFLIIVINHSYKGTLLSFLSFPSFSGIRDIQNLAKAAEQNSFLCYTLKGHAVTQILLESDIETWRSIGKCLKRTIMKSGNPDEFFLQASDNKAFLDEKLFSMEYERKYFISEDSFFNTMNAFPFSKQFTCQKVLNKFSRRLFETGVIAKLYQDENFLKQHQLPTSDNDESFFPKKLKIADFKETFLLLISGHTLAFFLLVIEIFIKYYSSR